MKMSKRHYRIGELAETLNVEKFVIRFWEKELGIKSIRSKGGQRFYQEKDFQKFNIIKELLYSKKFTLAGAKRELENMKNTRTVTPTKPEKSMREVQCDCKEKLALIKQELLNIKQAL
jgi:DNA-binding transcriptional MerR regulator